MSVEDAEFKLNFFQSYRRAVTLSKTTSRISNRDWYKKALELNFQIHLYYGADRGFEGYLFNKVNSSYQKLGSIDISNIKNQNKLENFIDSLLAEKEFKKCKSIGIILYVSDELSIASLGPEHQNPSDLNELSRMMMDNPSEVLEDKTVSIESHSWRLFPYSGAIAGSEFATAIVLSRKYNETMRLFREIGREKNIPIITSVLSAPVCSVASLPWFTNAKECGSIAVYNYANFTLLAFLNELGDLMMLRNMPHSTGSNFPKNIGSALVATANAFELEAPEISVLSLVGNDLNDLISSIQKTMPRSDIMVVDPKEILKSRELSPDIPLEILVSTQKYDSDISSLASNKTFTELQNNRWHLQGFLMPSKKELVMFPSWGDMKILKISKYVKFFGGIAAILIVAWHGYSIWGKLNSKEWNYTAGSTSSMSAEFQKEIKNHQTLDNVLQDRSKAWVNMQLIMEMMPDDASVMVESVTHQVKAERDSKANKAGLKKTWVIKGFTNEKGLVHLDKLSTRNKIEAVFNNVAEVTGNSAYLADVDQREILIDLQNNVNQRSNKTYDNYNVIHSFAFTMNITQTYSEKDQLAVKLK